MSFWAFASLCKSEGSFKSLLSDSADGDSESLLLEDTRVLALSDSSMASLSGMMRGTLEGASLTNCLPLSAEFSAGGTAEGALLSEGTCMGLGCTLVSLTSSECLRRLGDRSPREAAVGACWLDAVDLSFSEASTAVSETGLTGDFAVRASGAGRLGATLGLTEKRFLLCRAAEELLPSPFWSLPSLNGNKNCF